MRKRAITLPKVPQCVVTIFLTLAKNPEAGYQLGSDCFSWLSRRSRGKKSRLPTPFLAFPLGPSREGKGRETDAKSIRFRSCSRNDIVASAIRGGSRPVLSTQSKEISSFGLDYALNLDGIGCTRRIDAAPDCRVQEELLDRPCEHEEPAESSLCSTRCRPNRQPSTSPAETLCC